MFCRKLLVSCGSILLLALFASEPSKGDYTIETVSTYVYNSVGGVFIAKPSTRDIVGQTFTVVSAYPTLDRFTFFLDDRNRPVPFSAGVIEWDGSGPTGPLLFRSDGVQTTNNHGQGGSEAFEFVTPSLQLIHGRQYVAFLETDYHPYDPWSTTGNEAWVNMAGNAYVLPPNYNLYPGGYLVTARGTSDDITSFAWEYPWWRNEDAVGWDTKFSMTFSEPIPEPSTLILLVSGAIGLLAYTWRRRRR